MGYMLIGSKERKNIHGNNLYNNLGINQENIYSSDLIKYEEKGIKKRVRSKQKKIGNINCD